MKSLNTLIATLVIGSSSLALAEPVVRDHRDFDDPRVIDNRVFDHRDDHRDDRRDDRRVYDDRFDRRDDGYRVRLRRTMPISLAQNLEINMRRPAYIALDQRSGLRRLRLDADEGHAFVDSLVLMFADGSSQTLTVRQRVSSRSQPLILDIDGRATGVYIYGRTRGRGSLDVIGLRR